MTEYRLTEEAEEDLINIWIWSFGRWGDAQADKYSETLEACCDKIGARQIRGSSIEGFHHVSYYRCERHLIFYTQPEDQPLSIIAVLHERMDLPRRLAERLRNINN